MAGVIERLEAFVLERFPFALPAIQRVIDGRALPQPPTREAWLRALESELRAIDVRDLPETTPGVAAGERWKDAEIGRAHV